jgi:hypothetical protein
VAEPRQRRRIANANREASNSSGQRRCSIFIALERQGEREMVPKRWAVGEGGGPVGRTGRKVVSCTISCSLYPRQPHPGMQMQPASGEKSTIPRDIIARPAEISFPATLLHV